MCQTVYVCAMLDLHCQHESVDTHALYLRSCKLASSLVVPDALGACMLLAVVHM